MSSGPRSLCTCRLRSPGPGHASDCAETVLADANKENERLRARIDTLENAYHVETTKIDGLRAEWKLLCEQARDKRDELAEMLVTLTKLVDELTPDQYEYTGDERAALSEGSRLASTEEAPDGG